MVRPLGPTMDSAPCVDDAATRTMTCAVVTTHWGPPWNEGVRNITRCLVEFLKIKGHQVSVVAPPANAEPPRVLAVLRSIVSALAAAHRVRHLDADVVILIASLSSVLGLKSWVLRRWARKPLLLYVTGLRRFTVGYRAMLGADAVLVNSPALQAFFPHAQVVPPMIDPRRWRRTPRTAPPTTPVILFLGSFERCRGLEYLIRAMDAIPSELGATLRLAWNGVGKRRSAHIVRTIRATRAPERIQLLESADVRRLYAEASVVVIPRIRPVRMAFPLRIVEAVHMGVPVVVTRINGMHELVEGCGLAVPPRDPHALAAALTRLLTDSELYGRLAANCLEKARAWDPTRGLEIFHATTLTCR